ncbi:hypothetical protein JHN63_04355 [Streptomyces sp. MBT65]|nr:hypothetical protein [Streptomyces sp. MBT65]MBK3573064.1 hypothetical protein [Streptomyces sp. MBT65]
MAEAQVSGTGDWQMGSLPLKHKVTGSHDLYVVVKGAGRVAALDRLTIRP